MSLKRREAVPTTQRRSCTPVSAKRAIVTDSSAGSSSFRSQAHNNDRGAGRRKPPVGSRSGGRAVASGRPPPRAPCVPCQFLRNQFPRPHSPTQGLPDASLRVPSGLPAASPGAAAPRRASPAPHPRSPCSRFRFRSALGTTPPQARLPVLPGAEPLQPRTPTSPSADPAAPAPGTHPPPGTCWPPWPFPPPPPAAQRGPGGSRGQGSARGEAPSAGLALRGSLGRARAAGTSAASAVAVHPGPRCRRRRRYRLTPGTPRPAPVRSASSGTSSAPAGPEPGSGSPAPPPSSPSPTRRRALPAAGKACPARLGVRLLPEHLRPIRRTRPGARLRSESETPELGYFRKRFGSLRPTAARRSVISVAARPLPRGREKSWA